MLSKSCGPCGRRPTGRDLCRHGRQLVSSDERGAAAGAQHRRSPLLGSRSAPALCARRSGSGGSVGALERALSEDRPEIAKGVVQGMNTRIHYRKTAELPGFGVKLSVNVDEFYFEFVPPSECRDVCAGLCLSQPISGWLAYPRSTRIIDLSASPELLLKSCSRNNRYKIKRARQSDNVETGVSRRSLASTKSQSSVSTTTPSPRAKASHRFGVAKLDAMASAGKLVISAAVDGDGDVLATHAYLFEQHRARLTHSASLFRLQADPAQRNRIGRVNRLLHWDDIVRFRELGSSAYDMGGWYTGNRSDALLPDQLVQEGVRGGCR